MWVALPLVVVVEDHLQGINNFSEWLDLQSSAVKRMQWGGLIS